MYLIFQRTKILNISNVELVRTTFPAVCVADCRSVAEQIKGWSGSRWEGERTLAHKKQAARVQLALLTIYRRTVGKTLGLCRLWPSQDVNFYEHFFFAYTVPYMHILCTHMICIYHILYLYISICISKDSFFFKSTCTSTWWCWPFLYIRGKRGNVHIFLDMFKHTHEIPLYLWLYEVSAWVGGNPWLFQ